MPKLIDQNKWEGEDEDDDIKVRNQSGIHLTSMQFLGNRVECIDIKFKVLMLTSLDVFVCFDIVG